MLSKNIMPRSLRGFTLTEAAIVLGIVGLILGAIWVAAAAVYNNMRVSTTTNQLLQMVQSIRSMHATQQTVDAAITAELVAQAGGIPSDMITRDAAGVVTDVTDVWGGQVNVSQGASTDSFMITFANVPQGPCSDILVRSTGPGRDTGLSIAGAGGGTATAAAGTFPIGVAAAVGFCNVTAAAGNTLTFTFRLRG
ncbi:MAG TPA: hypothetical protein DCY07_08340 [Rhodospirillaceae bacterium]|nr:hypothetical protein [Rhodospirillaceae bacterium]